MQDRFFTVKNCDRCGKPLTTRIMSMFNTDVLCSECKTAETKRPDYKNACDADHEHIKAGDYNFKGIGLK